MYFYRITAESDEKLCEKCAEMNGKIYPVEDYEKGVTGPPFHPNCRCDAELFEAEDWDDVWDWTVPIVPGEFGLGILVGMKYDKTHDIIYNSKLRGIQKIFGYFDVYDFLSVAFMSFNLHASKTEVKVKVDDGNGGLVEKTLSHRIWMGDYMNSMIETMYFAITGRHFEMDSYYGGESSLLMNGGYMTDSEFEQKIELYDEDGVKILEFDTAEMYNERTADWVFACKYTELQPASIKGVLKHENKDYIEALWNADNEKITYTMPRQDKNGLWYTEWRYDKDALTVYSYAPWE